MDRLPGVWAVPFPLYKRLHLVMFLYYATSTRPPRNKSSRRIIKTISVFASTFMPETVGCAKFHYAMHHYVR